MRGSCVVPMLKSLPPSSTLIPSTGMCTWLGFFEAGSQLMLGLVLSANGCSLSSESRECSTRTRGTIGSRCGWSQTVSRVREYGEPSYGRVVRHDGMRATSDRQPGQVTCQSLRATVSAAGTSTGFLPHNRINWLAGLGRRSMWTLGPGSTYIDFFYLAGQV